MGVDREDQLAALQAKDEIRELTARYCWHVTRGDAAGLVELFAPDGSFEASVGGELQRVVGRDALLPYYQALGAGFVHPMVGNHIIKVNGDRATATCEMRNMIRQPDGGFIAAAGYYEDSFVHDGHAWTFQTRRFVTVAQTAP